MARTTRGSATRLGRAIGVVAAAMAMAVAMAMAQVPIGPGAADRPALVGFRDHAAPRAAGGAAGHRSGPERVEDDRCSDEGAGGHPPADHAEDPQTHRENKDQAKFFAAREAIFKEVEAEAKAKAQARAVRATDQIQLQAQGPLAFNRKARSGADGCTSGRRSPQRLKLSDDQVRKIRAIVTPERRRSRKRPASRSPWTPRRSRPPEIVLKLVESRNSRQPRRRPARRVGMPGPP